MNLPFLRIVKNFESLSSTGSAFSPNCFFIAWAMTPNSSPEIILRHTKLPISSSFSRKCFRLSLGPTHFARRRPRKRGIKRTAPPSGPSSHSTSLFEITPDHEFKLYLHLLYRLADKQNAQKRECPDGNKVGIAPKSADEVELFAEVEQFCVFTSACACQDRDCNTGQ